MGAGLRITVEAARAFFMHPSQRVFGLLPEFLPDDPFQYWAAGSVCLSFHPGELPGVWMTHIAANPSGWGRLDGDVSRVLHAFFEESKADVIMAWIPATLRHSVSLSRRVGFEEIGRFRTTIGEIIITTWRA